MMASYLVSESPRIICWALDTGRHTSAEDTAPGKADKHYICYSLLPDCRDNVANCLTFLPG